MLQFLLAVAVPAARGVNGVKGINGNVRTGKELAFKSVRVNYPEARMAGLFYIPNEK